ncbi:hypothetical protein SmJEL517_g00086 [Synchytrium microbalum]|uniref:NodB homology domain-containing protein n=1 Tax=Synchytrium microbalum TaxID=1806994 RepID=A0A507CJQ3_9FUNG|nr:uncharacterized protein SmJEL517_g00086 [Synchytrium microbalum]TPX38065.1 hypothetical protein SmJEL517_g00086 [Synchytrium microbalum]
MTRLECTALNYINMMTLWNYGFFILLASISIGNCQTVVSTNIFKQGFPPMDVIPPVDPAILALYDLSRVPNYPLKTLNTTTNNTICPASNVSCDFNCFGCTRSTDIRICPNDGPGPYTTGLLDFLDSVNVKTMFFAIGSRVSERPDITLREFQTGHVLAAHTWSHPGSLSQLSKSTMMLTGVPTEQIVMEMHYSVLAIEKVTGTRPKYARFPLGDADDRVRAIFIAMNLTSIMWDRDTSDWTSNDPSYHFQPQWIPNNFTDWIAASGNDTNGHISLEHDLFPISATEAPQSLNLLLKAGFHVESPAECIGDMRPYTNQSIVIPQSMVKGSTGVGLGQPATSGTSNRRSSSLGSVMSIICYITLPLANLCFLL